MFKVIIFDAMQMIQKSLD